MKALRVEFAERRPIRAWPWVVLVLMLAGIGAYESRLGWNQQGRLRELQVQQENLSKGIELAERTRREAADHLGVKPLYWADAVAITKLTSFPLSRALASIEAAQVLGVKVTGFEATASESNVRVDVEFTDHPALLAYLEAINDGEPAPRWVLVQAQVSSAATGNTATLLSNWGKAGR